MAGVKIWTGREKGNEKIIACLDQTIYRGNPGLEEIEKCVYDLKLKTIPVDKFVGIPFGYLKQVNLQDGKEYVEFLFGIDSYDHFRIKDIKVREEIFEFLKVTLPKTSYSVDQYSAIRAGKKALIAMVVVGLLFLWTLYISFGIEDGNEYEVTGGHYDSFAGIVLSLASLGVKKVVFIYGSLLTVALFSFLRKIRNPPTIRRLTVIR